MQYPSAAGSGKQALCKVGRVCEQIRGHGSFFLALGTLIIGLPGFWLRRGFINSITGLMTGLGTLWAESLEEQFTQV